VTLHAVGVVVVDVEVDVVVAAEAVVSTETSPMMRIRLLPMLVKVLLMERVGGLQKGLAMVDLAVLIVVVVADVEVSVMGKLVKMGNHDESMNVAVGLDAGNRDICSIFLGC